MSPSSGSVIFPVLNIDATLIAYSDFANLIALAVGLNLVYVAILQRNERFHEFLKDIANRSISKIAAKNESEVAGEEALKARLNFFISTGKLGDLEAHFQALTNRLNDVYLDSINCVKKYTQKINNHVCAKNLSHIALFSFLYGLYLLCAAPYAEAYGLNLNLSLFIPNIFILLFMTVCIAGEFNPLVLCKKAHKEGKQNICNGISRYCHQKMAPSKTKCIISFGVILILSLTTMLVPCVANFIESSFRFNMDFNYLLSVGMCFIGFVVYWAATMCIGRMFSRRYSKEIKKMNIPQIIKEYHTLVNKNESRLNKIEEELKKPIAFDFRKT